jgi:hypothetical protein
MHRKPKTSRRNTQIRIALRAAATTAAACAIAALGSSPMLAVSGSKSADIELTSLSNPAPAIAAATRMDNAWPSRLEIGSMPANPELARLTFKRGQTNSMD